MAEEELKSFYGRKIQDVVRKKKLEDAVRLVFADYESGTMQRFVGLVRVLLNAPYDQLSEKIERMYYDDKGMRSLEKEEIRSVDREVDRYKKVINELEEVKAFIPEEGGLSELYLLCKEAVLSLEKSLGTGKKYALKILERKFYDYGKRLKRSRDNRERVRLNRELEGIARSYSLLCDNLGINSKHRKRIEEYLNWLSQKQKVVELEIGKVFSYEPRLTGNPYVDKRNAEKFLELLERIDNGREVHSRFDGEIAEKKRNYQNLIAECEAKINDIEKEVKSNRKKLEEERRLRTELENRLEEERRRNGLLDWIKENQERIYERTEYIEKKVDRFVAEVRNSFENVEKRLENLESAFTERKHEKCSNNDDVSDMKVTNFFYELSRLPRPSHYPFYLLQHKIAGSFATGGYKKRFDLMKRTLEQEKGKGYNNDVVFWKNVLSLIRNSLNNGDLRNAVSKGFIDIHEILETAKLIQEYLEEREKSFELIAT
ncbi:hypothetical protein DRJ16_02045 [Candidatus Woesearchaeota archaeon]|nr:MAG: hypothetical protein DRJ16_02045 [Candidatus Woesearchaeota archaeon]